MSQKQKVFDIPCHGITCVGCAQKIMKSIPNNSEWADQIDVNILGQSVQVVLNEGQDVSQIVKKLVAMNFKVPSEPYEILLKDEKNKRIIFLDFRFVEKQDFLEQSLIKFLVSILGIQEVDSIYFQGKSEQKNRFRLKIVYNPLIIKGRIIWDKLEDYLKQDENLKKQETEMSVYDPHIESLQQKEMEKDIFSVKKLVLSFFVFLFYLVFAIILPGLDSTTDLLIFPYEWNIFSIYFTILLLFTIFILNLYGKKNFVNAYNDLVHEKQIAMEGLVALGVGGSIIMSIYLIIVYFIQEKKSLNDLQGLKHHFGFVSEQQIYQNYSQIEINNLDRKLKISQIIEYLETTGLILTFLNVGKFLEGRAKEIINRMTESIFPKDILVSNSKLSFIEFKNKRFLVQNEKPYEVSLLETNDIVKIQAPMRLLVDGTIVHKPKDSVPCSIIDSLCFGTLSKFEPNLGQKIKSGAEIVDGVAYLQLDAPIEQSMLLKVSNQLNIAQNQSQTAQTGIAGVFKKAADNFSKFVIFISFVTLFSWIGIISSSEDDDDFKDYYCKWCIPFERAIAVLVASCPCGLGLAIPSVIVVALNLGLKNHLLLKKNRVFDRIGQLKGIVFDKTGTLFNRCDELHQTYLVSGDYLESQIWEIILVVERRVRHPLAQFLYDEAVKRISRNLTELVYNLSGEVTTLKKGIKAEVLKENQCTPLQVWIGNRKFILEEAWENLDEKQKENYTSQIDYNQIIVEQIDQATQQTQVNKADSTIIYVAINHKIVYSVFLSNIDNLRPEAKEVIQYLQNTLKKDVYILSGDLKESVQQVAKFLSVPENNAFGEQDALKKQELIAKIKNKDEVLMMIGDGMNDILSIKEAGIGVSINAQSELNLIASDVIVLNENLWNIASLIKIVSYSKRFMIFNLIWALSYNIFILPVSAGIFQSEGLIISPMVASAAMSGSDLMILFISNLMQLFDFSFSKQKSKSIQIQENKLKNQNKYQIATQGFDFVQIDLNKDIPDDLEPSQQPRKLRFKKNQKDIKLFNVV